MQRGHDMRKPKWTREEIIRRILDCDAKGYSLTVSHLGISQPPYQAGTRIFGSWRNALQAAGISPNRSRADKWRPAKILLVIRKLSQRRRPLRKKELEERFGNLVSAARRIFGSWSKAILASGVDPVRLQRITPWTRERVLEVLLTRALRNEPIAARAMEPRSIVDAGRRLFGSWPATLEAAGLDLATALIRPRPTKPCAAASFIADRVSEPPLKPSWNPDTVVAAIRARLHQQKPLNAKTMLQEENSLYRAGRRYFKSWRNALLAAGLCPDKHRRIPRRPSKLSGIPRNESREPGTACDSIDSRETAVL